MAKQLDEVGADSSPETIWTLPVEKVKNDKGGDEYIISLPDKVRKHLKLKDGDRLFWGERAKNSYEVRKASKDELQRFKIDLGQSEAERMERERQRSL
jgi:bifunctional DNA-binding transcriptional regulator/antitoxin component of YhaV-PrlF toxin-antitoxin module